ncbi:MAG: HD-GYP domain-containing protein [Burkholderiaceae bacterium]|nr:HD-GYP domain-containing protein [Burkholderiaceae bacterium]
MTQVAEKKTRKPKAPPQRAALDETDGSDVPAQLKRYRLAATDVAKGMFVAELDRPWLDTPFLLQGFLVETDDEVATLRKFSRFVFVDIELSNPEVVEAIRAAEIKGGDEERRPSSSSFRLLSTASSPQRDKRLSASTRAHFRRMMQPTDRRPRGFLARLLDRLLRLVGLGEAPVDREADARRRRAELRKCLPEGVALRRYRDRRTVEEELPRAQAAFTKSRQALEQTVRDLTRGETIQVERLSGAVDDMVRSMLDNPDALMWVARLRDADESTYAHAVKVALYMVALGRHLGLPKEELAKLGMVGILADVGKTRVPRALLEKPGMLTDDEYAIVKEHVRLGIEALHESFEPDPEVEAGIAQHHERLDGSGYPRGLKGDEIGLFGRIAAIADSFAAMITPRAYANPTAAQDALMNLFEWAGSSFHEPLVEQFVQAVGIFPTGSFVELSTGEVAIVLAHNRVRRLEPKVLVLTWPDKRPLSTPIERNLLERPVGTDGRPIRILRGLPPGAFGLTMHDYYGNEMASANGLL